MSHPQPLGEIIHRNVDRLKSGLGLPTPLPAPMASAVRSLVTTSECAALAGIEPEHFDTLLGIARRAYQEKLSVEPIR